MIKHFQITTEVWVKNYFTQAWEYKGKFVAETYAVSEAKAITNFKFQARKEKYLAKNSVVKFNSKPVELD